MNPVLFPYAKTDRRGWRCWTEIQQKKTWWFNAGRTGVTFSSWHSGLAWSDFIVFLSALTHLLTAKPDSFHQPNIFSFKRLFSLFQTGDSMTICKQNNCNYGYCTCPTDADSCSSYTNLNGIFLSLSHTCSFLWVLFGCQAAYSWDINSRNLASSCWLVAPHLGADSCLSDGALLEAFPMGNAFKMGGSATPPSLPFTHASLTSHWLINS